jgi:imidazolonepropionase-like amidohydrolase
MPIATFLRCVTKFLLLASLIGSFVRLSAASAAAGEAQPLLIRDVRLFDGHRVFEHRSVLVAGGVIRAIGGPNMGSRGAQVIDGRGKTLLPGIIDAHVHVSPGDPEGSLVESARFGVTTDLDMFTSLDGIRKFKAIEAADPPRMADLRSAGVGASAARGVPGNMDPSNHFPTLSSPDQAQAFVDARIAEGSDYIKVIADDGSSPTNPKPTLPALDIQTIRAVIVAAHRRGKMAVVHAFTERWARAAIAAGADGLVHAFLGPSASPDFGRYAAAHHIFVVPTLTVEYARCNRSDGPALAADPRVKAQLSSSALALLAIHWQSPDSCNATDQAVRELRLAGVPILTGTDAPVPGSAYGVSTLDEMALFVADGLTPVEALIAGTSAPAKAFHLNDRGEIRVGKRADLVLIDGDPTRYIDSVKNISGVWKRGLAVPRVTESPAKPAA